MNAGVQPYSPSQTADAPCVELTVDSDVMPFFHPLLQRGFLLKVWTDFSIKETLCGQLGVDPEYFENRIKTLFLDGTAVDDADGATVKHGSTLALSAAMPGLVGATMRRGGYYATMRLQVPKEQPEGSRGAGKEGLVLLKLFNLLVGEMGPAFLERGVLVPRGDLQNSLRDMPESFWEGCRLVRMDGEPVDPEKLLSLDRLTEHELVRLKVLQAS